MKAEWVAQRSFDGDFMLHCYGNLWIRENNPHNNRFPIYLRVPTIEPNGDLHCIVSVGSLKIAKTFVEDIINADIDLR